MTRACNEYAPDGYPQEYYKTNELKCEKNKVTHLQLPESAVKQNETIIIFTVQPCFYFYWLRRRENRTQNEMPMKSQTGDFEGRKIMTRQILVTELWEWKFEKVEKTKKLLFFDQLFSKIAIFVNKNSVVTTKY